MGGPVVSAKVQAPAPTGLARDRIIGKLSLVWTHRLGLVVAPAGYGKTTALANFAQAAGVPTAWYRVEAWDADETTLLRHLASALDRVLPGLDTPWETIGKAIAALEGARGARTLLIIDDLHTIEGTPAEAALERFVELAPSNLAVVAASRSVPGFNLSRLRVLDQLVELDDDDLRFRQWEVERLFRDFYAQPLAPEELAELARRTDGWAAGLQLFHLATHSRSRDERRRVLRGLNSHSRLIREYLSRNVLDQLPRDLRQFLIATSVLGWLSGPLCDRYLERTGSRAMLIELERRRVFTQSIDGEITFRYHEVLRSHLEMMLAEEAGETALRAMCQRAGGLLEEAGALPEALRAYSRAEDSDAVGRLLGKQGSRLASAPGQWIEWLPRALLEHDPWLLLARARHHASEGRPVSALDAYRHAESGFAGSAVAMVCRDELLLLQAWANPGSTNLRGDHWSSALYSLVRGRLASTDAPEASVENAVAHLLRGSFGAARESADDVVADPDVADTTRAIAIAIVGLVSLLMGDATGMQRLVAAEDHAERAGAGWLARLARAARSVSSLGDAPETAAAVRMTCERDSDRWGEATAALFQGWGAIDRGEAPVAPLEVAVAIFSELGAPVPATWARALLALAMARIGHADAHHEAVKAEKAAQRLGIPAASVHAYMALAMLEPDRAGAYRDLARRVVAGTGAHLSADVPLQEVAPAPEREGIEEPVLAPHIEVTIFGGLTVHIDGRRVDLSPVKPRVRSLLRFLAAQGGEPVHRDVICEALWPEADADAALRGLQVAVSSLRQVLTPAGSRGDATWVRRDGGSYRLAEPGAVTCDIVDFRHALDAARRNAGAGEVTEAAVNFAAATDRLAAELLPEEGPAEWANAIRRRLQSEAIDVAERISASALAEGSVPLAASICRRALQIDPYCDRVWESLIGALELSGDNSSAERERARYNEMVTDLDVPARRARAAVNQR